MRIIFIIIYLTMFLKADENVSIQLLWKHQFEFAGIYIAKELGYYKESGINVEIREFNFEDSVVNSVLNGDADFGVGYSSILIDRAEGKKVKALASFFQRTPSVLLTKKRDDLNRLEDFRNKVLNISYTDVSYSAIRAMLQSKGIGFSGIRNVPNNYDINLLINNQIDGYFAYISNEPYYLKELGVEYNIWSPSDYGFDFYEDILFTSEKFIENKPEVVKNFYKATIRGWEYAFSHLEESVDLILKKYNSQNKSREALMFEAKELLKLAKVDNIPLGDINKERLKVMEGIYRVLGFISTSQSPSKNLIYRVNSITLTDREQEYLKNLKEIKYVIDPNWMPYEKINNERHIGFSLDYIKLFEERLNVPFKLIQTDDWSQSLEKLESKEAILAPLIIDYDKRDYLNFTPPYLSFPLVIATDSREIFISDIDDLKEGTKVAVLKDEAVFNLIKNRYPKLELIEVNSVEEGLDLVLQKDVYGFIDTLLSVSYEIREHFSGLIHIIGKLELQYNLSVGVSANEPILFSIMTKTINSIGEEFKQKSLNKIVDLEMKSEEIDYLFFIKILVALVIFSLFLIYRNIVLKKLHLEIEREKRQTEEILTSISLPIIIASQKTKEIRFANKFASMQFEDYNNILVGEKVDIIYTGDKQRGKIRASFNRFGRVDNLELQFKTVNGEKVFFGLLSLVPINYLEEKSYLGVVSVIEKQKRRELFLSKQKSQVENILSASLTPIVIFSRNIGEIRYTNRSARTEFKDSKNSLIDLDISNIYWNKDNRVILNLLGGIDIVENIEIEFKRLDGNKFYGLLSIIEIDYYGEECYLMNISPIDKQIERELLLKEEKRLITDSIKYASTIQEKLLPNNLSLNYFFAEQFLIWQPRDIVGGDIYFFEPLNENEILIFIIDGTGHGVPGAFLTVMVKLIERQILDRIKSGDILASDPSAMLSIFDREIREILNQKGDSSNSHDGFDGSILYYNKKNRILNFSGALSDLRYVDGDEFKLIKGDRRSVGYKNRRGATQFRLHSLNVNSSITIYLTTDGFIDQIGGESEMPFGSKRLERLIMSNYLKPLNEQKDIFINKLLIYQGDNERQDDITLISLKL